MGFAGMGSDVHSAIGCNIFRQISGRKKVCLCYFDAKQYFFLIVCDLCLFILVSEVVVDSPPSNIYHQSVLESQRILGAHIDQDRQGRRDP